MKLDFVNCAHCGKQLTEQDDAISSWGEPVHDWCGVLLRINEISNGEAVPALNAIRDGYVEDHVVEVQTFVSEVDNLFQRLHTLISRYHQ